LTGATITSKAVTAAVNQALDIYASVSAEYAQGGANNG
ncbi:MAG: FMN-binding protein, partial [Clostridia bacterium]|nr:FMN-binding protein [Clostridia bacterium]